MSKSNPPGPIVEVRRQWDDWRRARYYLSTVSNLHWSNVSGGVGAPTPQLFIHGYVQCDGMIDGELAHSGTHGQCPHEIKVCIVKKGNEDVWQHVLKLSGPRPQPHAEHRRTLEVKRRFKDRGFSPATITALVKLGIDFPERLLVLDLAKARDLQGIGPVKLREIEAYRAAFLKTA